MVFGLIMRKKGGRSGKAPTILGASIPGFNKFKGLIFSTNNSL